MNPRIVKYFPWIAGLGVWACLAVPFHFRAQSTGPGGASDRSVLDILNRPYAMAFSRPTSLEEVAARLQADLGISVVLDRAALIRLELVPGDTVQLELAGARLKTSLQLLLDQVDMTYRGVPEDNLLVLTDDRGADDPFHLLLEEIHTIHSELHDLRDELQGQGRDDADGHGAPAIRQPTIIEEITPQDTPAAPDRRLPEAGSSAARRGRTSA